VTARVQELLQELEGRLGQTDAGYRSLVFYQLRELWSGGQALLAQFVGELAAQQEERERRLFLAEHNRRQFPRLQAAEEQARAAASQLLAARSRVQDLEAGSPGCAALALPKRLKLRPAQPVNLRALLAEQGRDGAPGARRREADRCRNSRTVDRARRAINIAVIAYALALRGRLAGTRLFDLAREASGRREPPEHYGARADCERLMVEIQRGRVALQQRASLAQELKERTEALKSQARYRHVQDTTPVADSNGGEAAAAAVVLEDAWEICRVLLR
jgi:hypothetical protein